MPSSRSFVIEFALKVFAPSLLAAAAIALFLFQLINGIFAEANRLDHSYARRNAESVLLMLRQDAARAAESGSSGSDSASFLVDDSGRTLAATVNGQRSGLTALDYFGRNLDPIVKVGQPVFFLSGSDIAVAAAAPREENLFIAATRIGAERLNSLSRQLALEHLRFDVPGQDGVAIVSGTGLNIATLRWSDRRPGDVAQHKYRDTITAALTTFMFVVGLLIYMSWRGFKDAHESKARAIAESVRDDLTGLPNRRGVLETLDASLRNGDGGLTVVYADLDGFKEVNDAYGREIGDRLLKATAAGFAFLADGKHLVARFNGDEFAMIVEGQDHEDTAQRLAHHIIAFLAAPMVFDGRVASVSASIGIAHADPRKADAEELLRRADVAMTAAKDNGRNRIEIYEPALDIQRDENRSIASELRGAIEQRRLGVVYQPIVDARTRRIAGVEALVRWPADSDRQIAPDIFIPVAEEHGLIEDLGFFVLSEACDKAARWDDITISVNVSPVQFMNPAFAGLVALAVARSGLDPRRLEIEVTEGFVIDNAQRTQAIIDQLHEMRVSVVLDDFGTGYSSIGHLRRFKFDKIKLDRSMVKDIMHQPSALRLVQGTVAMADALGLPVTAEGIEDENQVSVLRLAGCSQFQGYLFSRPVDSARITALLNPPETASTEWPARSLKF